MAQSIIFVTGGVRSGKSSFAEQTALFLAKESHGNLHYIACGQASDPEMRERIQHHQQTRSLSEYQWKTWELAKQIDTVVPQLNKQSIVLLDCLTTLLNNELFDEGIADWEDPFYQVQVKQRIIKSLLNIQKSCHTLIIVSNEVCYEPVIKGEGVFMYTKLLGELHQFIVKHAAYAYFVEAGLPVLMKGDVKI